MQDISIQTWAIMTAIYHKQHFQIGHTPGADPGKITTNLQVINTVLSSVGIVNNKHIDSFNWYPAPFNTVIKDLKRCGDLIKKDGRYELTAQGKNSLAILCEMMREHCREKLLTPEIV